MLYQVWYCLQACVGPCHLSHKQGDQGGGGQGDSGEKEAIGPCNEVVFHHNINSPFSMAATKITKIREKPIYIGSLVFAG